MKKLLVVACAAMLAAGAVHAYKDGVYQGEGKGRESTIQVEVTVKDQKVADIKVLKQGETEMIFGMAIEQLKPEIIEHNGTKGVDTVGGATMSSKGIIAAVNDALSKAQ